MAHQPRPAAGAARSLPELGCALCTRSVFCESGHQGVVAPSGLDHQHGVGWDAWLICSGRGSEFIAERAIVLRGQDRPATGAVNSPEPSLIKTASDAEHVAARPGTVQASCRRSPGRGARPLLALSSARRSAAASSEREQWSWTRPMIMRPRSTATSTSSSTSSTTGACGGDWRTSRARAVGE